LIKKKGKKFENELSAYETMDAILQIAAHQWDECLA